MAGDWLKWGIGLTTKREILELASRLMIVPAHAAGCVMVAMEWVDQNVTDFDPETCHAFVTLKCCAPNILDNIVGVAGFTEAMAEVGWMTRNGDVLCFVHAGRHNGKSAKNRALNTERQRRKRDVSDVTKMSRTKRDASSLSLLSSVSDEGDGKGKPPSEAEWLAECAVRFPGWPKPDAQAAWNHYEANGWRSGKNPVRRWKACVATCYHTWEGKNPALVGVPAAPNRRQDTAIRQTLLDERRGLLALSKGTPEEQGIIDRRVAEIDRLLVP
jgi:hypothetical protein